MDGNSDSIAATWIAKRAGDRWSDADQAALDQWLQQSTRNRVAFVRAQAAWKNAARLKALSAGVPPGVLPKPDGWNFSPFFDPTTAAAAVAEPAIEATVPSRPPARSLKRFGALAAGILLVVTIATWSLWPAGQSYLTPVGGLAIVPIADGSSVTLGTDSKIRVALSQSERRVSLDRGEAFFDVAKDSTRPFVVVAGDRRVVAVGTQFSVRREAGDVRVVVAEGRVRVEEGSGSTASSYQLGAGDVARAGSAGTEVHGAPLSEVEEVLSWRSGYLVFRDVTIAEAVAEFNRYAPQKIVIADATVASLRVGGKFRSTNVGGFLRLLEAGYPVRVLQQNGETTLLGSAERAGSAH
ncbi:FecR family protein [Steroidobacter sp.]|uniref:FecR family protein n=1 Tax=Steroidobacter sp. TaxID=1978227 RepID=UPI001A40EE4D|nr:FecR domain-containing protein [Steroidobacter sp.]MBL8268477.1 FecR domain-containing protein [Steroidobacter sp.]